LRGRKHGADADRGEDLIFGAMHGCEIPVGSIVEPAKVQHPVEGIEQKFLLHRNPMRSSPPASLRDANYDLASGYVSAGVLVQGEGQYVRRPRQSHEPLVQLGHAPVTDEGDGKVREWGGQVPMRGAEAPTQVWNVNGSDPMS
jgi:hypothetical protein